MPCILGEFILPGVSWSRSLLHISFFIFNGFIMILFSGIVCCSPKLSVNIFDSVCQSPFDERCIRRSARRFLSSIGSTGAENCLCCVMSWNWDQRRVTTIFGTWNYFLLFIAMRYLCWSCSIFWLWFRVIASSVRRTRIRRVRLWAALFGNEHDSRVKVRRAFPRPELGVALFFLRHPL